MIDFSCGSKSRQPFYSAKGSSVTPAWGKAILVKLATVNAKGKAGFQFKGKKRCQSLG